MANKNTMRERRWKRLSVKAQTGAWPQFIPYERGHKAKVARRHGKS